MRDTLVNRVRSPAERIPQAPEISAQNDKVIRSDRFCLTELVTEGYFAGSPPSGCGGKEAASATCCGGIVDSESLPGDGRWIRCEW